MPEMEMPNHPFDLPQGELLSLAGPEATAFAQAQFMNDVEALAPGTWQWNGWLDAKGRLKALFALFREDDQRLLAWLPAGGAEPLAAALLRFRFRSKVQIQPDRGRRIVAVCGAAGGAPGGFALPADARLGARHLRLQAAAAARAAPGSIAAWHAADLRLGLPWLHPDGAAAGRFVPQWLALESLPALSLRKGCYPGQEIVARMHYLGQSKRAPALLAGTGQPPAGGWRVLDAEGQALGEVADAVADGQGGWLALAALAGGEQAAAAQVSGGDDQVRRCAVAHGTLRTGTPPPG